MGSSWKMSPGAWIPICGIPFPWTAWSPCWRRPWMGTTYRIDGHAGPMARFCLDIFVQDPDQRIGVLFPALPPDHFPFLVDHQGGQALDPQGLGKFLVLVHIDLDHLSLFTQGRGHIP